jgi:hypothetical protein
MENKMTKTEVTKTEVTKTDWMLRVVVERDGVQRTFRTLLSSVNNGPPKVGEAWLYSPLVGTMTRKAWVVVEVEEVPASEADLLRFQREGSTVPMVIAE